MKSENAISIQAGTIMLTSISLASWVSQWWLRLGAFAGINLIPSALSGFCPVESAFNKLGIGEVGGGGLGFADNKFVGGSSGMCPLTSHPVMSTTCAQFSACCSRPVSVESTNQKPL